MSRQVVRDFLRRQPGPGPGAQPKPADAPFVVRAGYAGALPGQWGSDHLQELQGYTDFTYLAVHTACKQFAQASVTVKTRTQAAPQGTSDTLAKGFASAPDAADDEKTPNSRHPLALRLKRPNPLTSGRLFRYQVGQQIRLTGGAVIWERRNNLGQPLELWIIPRGWLFYQRPTHEMPFGFWRVTPIYSGRWMQPWVSQAGNWPTTWTLDVRQTLRIGWTDPLYPGEYTSPLNACARIIDTASQTERAVWSQLAKGIRPSAILSIITHANGGMLEPLTEAQIDTLRSQLTRFMGPDGDGEAIIGNNIGVEKFDADLAKLCAIEARNQNQEMVFGSQGVPTAATGALKDTSYAGYAAGMNGWVELSIQPDLDIIGDAFTHRWENSYQGEPEVCIDAKRFDDPTLDLTRVDKLLTARQAGVPVTDNQILVALKLPKVPGGDEPPAPPMQMGPDGMPVAADAGLMSTDAEPSADPSSDFSLDLEPDLSGDTTTGMKRPDLQRGSGSTNRFSLNGRGH